MGIHGLWHLLDSFGEVTLPQEWRGKRVAIDASIWMVQFRARARPGDDEETQILEGFLLRILKLLFYGIEPVFVFDGPAGALKESERNRRAVRRQRLEARARHRHAQRLVTAHIMAGMIRLGENGMAAAERTQENDFGEVVKGEAGTVPPHCRSRVASPDGSEAEEVVISPAKRGRDGTRLPSHHLWEVRKAGEVERSIGESRIARLRRRALKKRDRATIETYSSSRTREFLEEAKVFLDSARQGDTKMKFNILAKSSSSLFMGPRSAVDTDSHTPQVALLETPEATDALEDESSSVAFPAVTVKEAPGDSDVIQVPREEDNMWMLLARGTHDQADVFEVLQKTLGTKVLGPRRCGGVPLSADVPRTSVGDGAGGCVPSLGAVDSDSSAGSSAQMVGGPLCMKGKEGGNDRSSSEATVLSGRSGLSSEPVGVDVDEEASSWKSSSGEAVVESRDSSLSSSPLSEWSCDSCEGAEASRFLWNPSTQLCLQGGEVMDTAAAARRRATSRGMSLEREEEFDVVPIPPKQSSLPPDGSSATAGAGQRAGAPVPPVVCSAVSDGEQLCSSGSSPVVIQASATVVDSSTEDDGREHVVVPSQSLPRVGGAEASSAPHGAAETVDFSLGGSHGAAASPRVVEEPRPSFGSSQADRVQRIPMELLSIVDLLRHCGIPFIISPAEADAQCAFLSKHRLVDAVFTEDSDVVAHGAQVVLRGFFSRSGSVVQYNSAYLAACGITKEVLVSLALLLGCDYTNGVEGVGLVGALNVLAASWLPLASPAASRSDSTAGQAQGAEHIIAQLSHWKSMVMRHRSRTPCVPTALVAEDDVSISQWALLNAHMAEWCSRPIPLSFPPRDVVYAFYYPKVDTAIGPLEVSAPNWPGLWRFASSHGLLERTSSVQLFELAKKECEARSRQAELERSTAAGLVRQATMTEFGVVRQVREKWAYRKQPLKHASALARLRDAQSRGPLRVK